MNPLLLIFTSILLLFLLFIGILISYWLYLYITHEYLFQLSSRWQKYKHSRHYFSERHKIMDPEFHRKSVLGGREKQRNREPLIGADDAMADGEGEDASQIGNLSHRSVSFHCIIVGGGPVGMTLASNLARKDISFLLLEKRNGSEHTHHSNTLYRDASKAIGVHPESLEHFSILDSQLVSEWIQESVLVKTGRIYAHNREILGYARLNLARKPFGFSLALEQTKTESVLENGLRRIMKQEQIAREKMENLEHSSCVSRSPSRFLKGVEVTCVEELTSEHSNVVTRIGFLSLEEARNMGYRYIVGYTDIKNGAKHYAVSRFVIGCEGKRSLVRNAAQIEYEGAPLRDTFIAGDFVDNTEMGEDAAIFLSREGLVEAFPLPHNRRRFICSTERYIDRPTVEDIASRVKACTDFDISGQTCTWITKFGIQSLVAQSFFKDGLILAGDSAHICSPLGGQGMNCGFLDAFELSDSLERIIHQKADEVKELTRYQEKQKRRAHAAIHRAELNTALGRKSQSNAGFHIRNWFVKMALVEFFPVQWLISMYFTMRFLGYFKVGKHVLA